MLRGVLPKDDLAFSSELRLDSSLGIFFVADAKEKLRLVHRKLYAI